MVMPKIATLRIAPASQNRDQHCRYEAISSTSNQTRDGDNRSSLPSAEAGPRKDTTHEEFGTGSRSSGMSVSAATFSNMKMDLISSIRVCNELCTSLKL